METTNGSGSDSASSFSSPSSPSSIAVWPPLRFFRFPVSTLLEYSGILRVQPDSSESMALLPDATEPGNSDAGTSGSGEVTIRIIGTAEQDRVGIEDDEDDEAAAARGGEAGVEERGVGGEEAARMAVDSGAGESGSGTSSDSSYQRYDIQQIARWIEQVLPFSLLLLVVFIRQHLQGFFVTIWITAFMFKSNDILRKQTALKGERKMSILFGYFLAFVLHVIVIYWWYRKDDLFFPLFMVPPKAIPPFWHAVFIILVNDTMVRQAAMALKLVLLMHYKNGRGHNFRRQGQILTLVEYTLLLYRALLPTPVWYRFFLNKDYGSLFSSLTTGLYLTFKLTTIVEKVQSCLTALKALSRKELHYGSYATTEQVNAAGDLCAICQEKMHAPILLSCKHIFCEDCVSEWFERERTCPLCRALVRPADLRSFGDGSTSLFFQLF